MCRLYEDALWEQITKQLFGEEIYGVALKSLRLLVLDRFNTTTHYPSNGWVENQPHQLFFSYLPVHVQHHRSYRPVCASQMLLNARICAGFEPGTIVLRKRRMRQTKTQNRSNSLTKRYSCDNYAIIIISPWELSSSNESTSFTPIFNIFLNILCPSLM